MNIRHTDTVSSKWFTQTMNNIFKKLHWYYQELTTMVISLYYDNSEVLHEMLCELK